jgi:hypothetical protein
LSGRPTDSGVFNSLGPDHQSLCLVCRPTHTSPITQNGKQSAMKYLGAPIFSNIYLGDSINMCYKLGSQINRGRPTDHGLSARRRHGRQLGTLGEFSAMNWQCDIRYNSIYCDLCLSRRIFSKPLSLCPLLGLSSEVCPPLNQQLVTEKNKQEVVMIRLGLLSSESGIYLLAILIETGHRHSVTVNPPKVDPIFWASTSSRSSKSS